MASHPDELGEAIAHLRSLAGTRVQATLRYGDYVLARFPMSLEDVDAEDEVLTLLGDVQDTGDMLLYSEVSLPVPHDGQLQLDIAPGELRLTTPDGLTLEVIALGRSLN